MTAPIYLQFLTAFIISVYVLASHDAAGEEIHTDQARATEACRLRLGEAGHDPNGFGGWSIVTPEAAPDTLCLYGNLSRISERVLTDTLASRSRLDLVVRSTGGPVERWLTIAEHLASKIDRLFIDEACFSSCANYLVPIARDIVADADSLVVWHGGPVSQNDPIVEPDGNSITTVIEYDAISRRTEALYAQHNVSMKLLTVSARPAHADKFSAVTERLKLAGRTPALSGYAFSPVRLTVCFGLRNLRHMQHRGDDFAIARLGQARSPNLLVFESPFPSKGVTTVGGDCDVDYYTLLQK